MKLKKNMRLFAIAGAQLLLFILFTAAVANVDVQPIGPNASSVGFASANGHFRDLIGNNDGWYKFTEVLGVLSILVMLMFAAIGVIQLVTRKALKKVDSEILALAYSTPSWYSSISSLMPLPSTTARYSSTVSSRLLPLVAFDARRLRDALGYPAAQEASARKGNACRQGRVHSRCGAHRPRQAALGRHWFTDIVGGVLLSCALTALYYALAEQFRLALRP